MINTVMDLQPDILENSMVKIIPLKESDFDRLFSVASDPLIWEQHPTKDRYKREVFQLYFDGAMASGGAFLIVDKATDEPIGSTRFYDYKQEPQCCHRLYIFSKKVLGWQIQPVDKKTDA